MPLRTRGELIRAVAKGELHPRSPDPAPAHVLAVFDNMRENRSLRNDTAAGHGFAPVREDALRWGSQPVGAQDLLARIETHLRPMQVLAAIPTSPWQRMRTLLEALVS